MLPGHAGLPERSDHVEFSLSEHFQCCRYEPLDRVFQAGVILETAPNGAVTEPRSSRSWPSSPRDHYLCDLSSVLEVVLNLRSLLFNACELTMAPDDLSRQHPPTSPAAPSLATRLGSVPLASDVVSETQEAYVDMAAARVLCGSVAPRHHPPANYRPEFSRPRPWTGEENVDLRLHPGSTLHTQGQAVIGELHDFGLQPNHNFLSTNVAHSRVFNFGAGDCRQF